MSWLQPNGKPRLQDREYSSFAWIRSAQKDRDVAVALARVRPGLERILRVTARVADISATDEFGVADAGEQSSSLGATDAHFALGSLFLP
ncbi:hypothetical protein ACFFWD_00250 [Bradyrhizobium erythrophlei]|uniref:hypothetical protein n=1 Tax=Bradyrhizobium erythrophlei TaxID=1437360 RepID=UPI0035ED13D2